VREYFDLDKQIVHLAIDKSVMFERAEIDVAEEMLRDNNYRNFVSCSKIKFAELIGGNLVHQLISNDTISDKNSKLLRRLLLTYIPSTSRRRLLEF